MLVGTTIFVFRRRQKLATSRGETAAQMPTYRTPLYPLLPIVFVAICLWFISFMLIDNPVKAWAGIFVVAMGWVAYRFGFKKGRG